MDPIDLVGAIAAVEKVALGDRVILSQGSKSVEVAIGVARASFHFDGNQASLTVHDKIDFMPVARAPK